MLFEGQSENLAGIRGVNVEQCRRVSDGVAHPEHQKCSKLWLNEIAPTTSRDFQLKQVQNFKPA